MATLDELRQYDHWVVWRYERRDGRRTKVPYTPGEKERKARSNDPSTWRSYDLAEAWRHQGFNGIGFELLASDPFCALDLDLCRDRQTGRIEPWAWEIVKRFDSYTEVTPSGEGLRIFCKGHLPRDEAGNPTGWRNKRLGEPRADGHTAGAEMYDAGKYLTITRQHLPGTAEMIREAQEAIDWLQANPPAQRTPRALVSHQETRGPLDDDALIKRASAASNGDKFARLWAGDTSMHGGDDSAADLALVSHLVYWTDGDGVRADRLFRRSGLMRPKWDERRNAAGDTYGEITLRKALERYAPVHREPKPAPLAVPKERGRLYTAEELDAMDLPAPQLVVEGILPKGLMILGGKPKAGKSFAILNVCIAVAAGGKAFGCKDVDAGDVLYLALEDTPRRLQDRQRMLLGGGKPPRGLVYANEWRNLAEGGLDDLEEWLAERPRKLFVVDTLVTVRELRKRNGDLYTEDYLAVNALTKLAHKYDCCGVLIHHLRKAEGDDPVDLLSGTLGLAGAADGVMVLKRTGKTAATLSVVHRDLDRMEYALEWAPDVGSWTITGDADSATESAARRAVLDVLEESQRRMRPSEIGQVLNKPAGPLRRLLWAMVRDGQVVTYPDHTYSPAVTHGTVGNTTNARNGGNAVTAVTPEVDNGKTQGSYTPPLSSVTAPDGGGNALTRIGVTVTALPQGAKNGIRAEARAKADEVIHLRCQSCNAWLTGNRQSFGLCSRCESGEDGEVC